VRQIQPAHDGDDGLIAALRDVYECALDVLRYDGVDRKLVMKAVDAMDEACELVKLIERELAKASAPRSVATHRKSLGKVLLSPDGKAHNITGFCTPPEGWRVVDVCEMEAAPPVRPPADAHKKPFFCNAPMCGGAGSVDCRCSERKQEDKP
jgi:hypothetical protein